MWPTELNKLNTPDLDVLEDTGENSYGNYYDVIIRICARQGLTGPILHHNRHIVNKFNYVIHYITLNNNFKAAANY